MTDLQAIEAAMRERLDDYRFAHTCSVKEECLRLASLFGMTARETDLLAQAALLHDCTKNVPSKEQPKLAKELGLALSEDDLQSPVVLHALTGAQVAKQEFGASDTVVFAIACHTTGKENMNLMEKLLFLADYIEPTRNFDDCVILRRYFYEELSHLPLAERLDAALLRAFDQTITQLMEEGYQIHPQTVKSRNFLLKKS